MAMVIRERLGQKQKTGRTGASETTSVAPWRQEISVSRRVMGEDQIASFRKQVAGEAGLMHRLVGSFAVLELSEPPAARRGVFS